MPRPNATEGVGAVTGRPSRFSKTLDSIGFPTPLRVRQTDSAAPLWIFMVAQTIHCCSLLIRPGLKHGARTVAWRAVPHHRAILSSMKPRSQREGIKYLIQSQGGPQQRRTATPAVMSRTLLLLSLVIRLSHFGAHSVHLCPTKVPSAAWCAHS